MLLDTRGLQPNAMHGHVSQDWREGMQRQLNILVRASDEPRYCTDVQPVGEGLRLHFKRILQLRRGIHRLRPHRNADTNTHSHTYPNADTNTHSDAYSNSHANCNADTVPTHRL